MRNNFDNQLSIGITLFSWPESGDSVKYGYSGESGDSEFGDTDDFGKSGESCDTDDSGESCDTGDSGESGECSDSGGPCMRHI